MTQKTTTDLFATSYHADGSVTAWNVYTQSWERTCDPSDKILATLASPERERVVQWTKQEEKP